MVCDNNFEIKIRQFNTKGNYYVFYIDVEIVDGLLTAILTPVQSNNTISGETVHPHGLLFMRGVFGTGNCWDCFAGALTRHLLLLATKSNRWIERFGDTKINSIELEKYRC